MTLRFEPLEQRTNSDDVYLILRNAILDGSLPGGSQLREAHIAADMGTSRAPLREALTKLEEEGLVARYRFKGAFVAEVSPETIAEIAAVRFLVEPYAAELSLDALRATEKKRMLATIKAMHVAGRKNDIPASIDAHLQFHSLFYECSGSGVLLDMWTGWETKLRLFLAADHRSYQNLDDIAVAHERLAEIALEGDMDVFRHELAHHVHSAPGAEIADQANAPAGAHEPPQAVG
ncbi:GntR family transcriptional regulator [Kribbella sp. NPDC050124]|uniref:GntR family transcriptional regulator n=1 Tax=Kribbella sp. NPDC050124 TaxID=3364114 RepID=UPI0037AAE1A5